jgi:hypothetical protein
MNFLYVTIFSFVPKKAIFGRGQVAATLLALSISFLLISSLLWIEYLISEKYFNIYLFTAIFVIPFLLCRWYFLNIKRFRKNLRLYLSQKRWVLKFIGISFFGISFFSQMIAMVFITILKNN